MNSEIWAAAAAAAAAQQQSTPTYTSGRQWTEADNRAYNDAVARGDNATAGALVNVRDQVRAANDAWHKERGTGPYANGGGGGGGSSAAADALKAQQDRLINITRDYFNRNGMGAFLSGMEKYIRLGYSGDEVMVMLANDADYKAEWDKRFAGNIKRRDKGLTELLPAAYLEMEQGYKQLYLKYGVPDQLFDDASDFADLIGNDVSAVEVNDRLSQAAQFVNYSGNAEVKRQLQDIYGMTDGEMYAYMLDPERTQAYLESETKRNMHRANVGGAAATQGLSLASEFRDEIASMYDAASSSYTSTFSDSTARFANVAKESPGYMRLAALSQEVASEGDLIREQFDLTGGAAITNKKRGLASQERARFSGSSGVGKNALSAGPRAR